MLWRRLFKRVELCQPLNQFLNLKLGYVMHVKSFSQLRVLSRNLYCHDLCWNSFQTSAVAFKRRKTAEEKQHNQKMIQFKPKSKQQVIALWPGITIKEVSKISERSIGAVFEALTYIAIGVEYQSPSSEIFDKTILLELAKILGYRASFISRPNNQDKNAEEEKDLVKGPKPDPNDLVKRPPVVTIMGHVDHGKTTLLDSLRNTSVVSQEHGGITQHIGAFIVKMSKREITFLDTPGHAAFQAMRSRGAHVTDFVVLVVAADDGIMEQTLESVRFARNANVPIIVAINKIDKPQADPGQVKKDLLVCGIHLEEFGGDIQAVCISALKKKNLDHLIEAILAQADLSEIKGDPKGPVEGVVLESSVDNRKGNISTVLIQRGSLKKGVILVAGTSWARVKSISNDHGKVVSIATPGIPVQVMGWKSLPVAGDILLQAESEKHACRVIKFRKSLLEKEKAGIDSIVIKKKLDQHLEQYRAARQERLMKGRYRKGRTSFREKEYVINNDPCFPFILKGDVHGSVEAIVDVLSTYKSHDDCRLDMLYCGVGDITENDITLAESFEGVVYRFNVGISPTVSKIAEEKNVTIKSFNVIYHLINDMKIEISKKLPLLKEEDVLGEASVLQEFLINEGRKKIHVAGCKCTKGILKRGMYCKVLRADEVMYDGSILSLKHEKTDVETIKTDVDCGLRLENPNFAFLPGDTIRCFDEKYIPRVTDWNPGF